MNGTWRIGTGLKLRSAVRPARPQRRAQAALSIQPPLRPPATGGSARFASPLGVYDFVKRTSLIGYFYPAFSTRVCPG